MIAVQVDGRLRRLTVINYMVTAASIGAAKGGGYARYLEGKTIAPERGDYYLSRDGEMTEAPGRWLANPETLVRLGIQPTEAVSGKDFISLMEGRHPTTGGWLRPEGAGGGRGGGIDVTFSAPKSVSVVWALSDHDGRERIEAAHANAVAQTVKHLKERVPVVRRRYSGQVVEEPAKDLIAAKYTHTTARGISGAQAPDPQLHSHLVITAAVRDDDRIVAVSSRPIFRAAGELGAFYRSALANELSQAGYQIQAGTGKDGKYFEIAGVPEVLREAFSGRSREVARAAERFRAQHGRAPERGELRDLALENRRAKTLATRTDLEHAWQETAERHGFIPADAAMLHGDRGLASLHDRPRRPSEAPDLQPLIDRIEQQLTSRHAVFKQCELHTVVLEQTAGRLSPAQALALAREMVAERRIIPLQDDRLTTLTIRAQEQAIERRAASLAQPAGRDAGDHARAQAARETGERIGAPLSFEQKQALAQLTGPQRLGALIGPAGTGKGVVIDAAARAEQHVGRDVLGIAVSGSTTERLGQDSPALSGRTLTLDALVHRANTGAVNLGPQSTIILDEAGMADHNRLDKLTDLADRTGAKLIAVGDSKQLPAIGPGGMFDRLTSHIDAIELQEVRRTQDPDERRAWHALRRGEPERAMAHYLHRGQLHLAATRESAAEAAVQHWRSLAHKHGFREIALIADASNTEIDRLNARAQHLRSQDGELGPLEVQLTNLHYGLRQGDLIAFAAQHRPHGQARVENGSRGEITHLTPDGTLTVRLDGSTRQITLQGDQIDKLRLAYAQHVYRQQGATVDRSVVLTGGWQTSRETAYVQATRARHGTEWFVGRDQLADDGQDHRYVDALARRMSTSRRPTPSTHYREQPDPGWHPRLDPTRRLLNEPYLRLLGISSRDRRERDVSIER